jgi:hypothetical protein
MPHDFIDLIVVLLSFGRSKQGEGKNKSPATAVHLQMTVTSLDGRQPRQCVGVADG